jgi:hypothetical protein
MSENILDRLRQLQIEILGVERRPSLDDVRWSHWLSDRRWYFLLSISVGIQRWWFQLAPPTSTRFDVRSVHEQHCFRLNSVSCNMKECVYQRISGIPMDITWHKWYYITIIGVIGVTPIYAWYIYIYVHTYYSSIYCWGSKSYPNLCSRGYSMLFQYQLLNNVLSIVPKPGREAPSSAREHTPHTPRLPPLQPVPGLRRSGKHDMSWMQHDSTALSATAWTVSPTGLN